MPAYRERVGKNKLQSQMYKHSLPKTVYHLIVHLRNITLRQWIEDRSALDTSSGIVGQVLAFVDRLVVKVVGLDIDIFKVEVLARSQCRANNVGNDVAGLLASRALHVLESGGGDFDLGGVCKALVLGSVEIALVNGDRVI